MADSTTLTPDEAETFRLRCHDFLAENTSSAKRNLDTSRRFQAALTNAELGGLTYASQYGGAGLTADHERIYRSEATKFPFMSGDFVISHGMCLPVINEFGTEDQKRRYMPDMISGKDMWCQMFSEPGAGSDVASLQMRAELDGDEWTLNGQKVWTTLAHESEYGIVLARTDPTLSKHAGISMFMVDLSAPGVEIRPIHQIDGGKHFNEVFFTDTLVPADYLIGEKNDGWRQATAMLMYERVAIGSLGAGAINQPLYRQLASVARAGGNVNDPVVRDQLMEIYCMETAKSLLAMRTRAEMEAGKAPGPGGSLGKLFGSVIAWRFREIALEINGPSGVAWDPSDETGGDLQTQVLFSIQAAIAGGTDEIQRNIVGDRVLGLPRDISVDKGVPFKDLQVGTRH